MLKRISSSFTTTGLAITATTVLLVGLVWAGSSASNETTDSTAPDDSAQPVDSPVDTMLPVDPSITRLLEMVKALDERLTVLERSLGDPDTSLIAALTQRIKETESAVAGLAAATSQLSSDGTYTGSIEPSQISPALSPDDLRGDWPLERTSGSLGLSRITVDGSGCGPDSRYVTVLVAGSFRSIECERLPR